MVPVPALPRPRGGYPALVEHMLAALVPGARRRRSRAPPLRALAQHRWPGTSRARECPRTWGRDGRRRDRSRRSSPRRLRAGRGASRAAKPAVGDDLAAQACAGRDELAYITAAIGASEGQPDRRRTLARPVAVRPARRSCAGSPATPTTTSPRRGSWRGSGHGSADGAVTR